MKKTFGLLTAFLMLFSFLASAVHASPQQIRIAYLDASSSDLPELSDLDVLFIDGPWLLGKIRSDSSIQLTTYIRDVVLSGVPTVTFEGGTAMHNVVKDLPIVEEVNQPVRAHALKVYPEKINGLIPSDELFIGGENATTEEIAARAYEWAVDRVSNTMYSGSDEGAVVQTTFSQTAGSPSWQLVATHYWTYYMSPYGYLDMKRLWYSLVDDGSNTYDWFNLVMETKSVPGKAVYGSDWRTADIWNWADVDYFIDPNLLIDHGPPTTSGTSTVNFEIGVQAGHQGAVVTCEMPVSYSVQDVPVDDQSDTTNHLAKWWHNVAEDKTVGMNAYTIKPGVTMRVLPIIASRLRNWYQVQYAQPNWFWGWIFPDVYMSPEFIVDTEIGYPRGVDVFVVKASDSSSSWVTDRESVKSGVLEAINDANTGTIVKLYNEDISAYDVTSTTDLFGLALNPPLRAVIVNTHGETVPMPSWYFGPSVHISSPSDGATIYSSPTVYADVYPPPGTSLQLCRPEGYTEWSYVWCMWYRPSTGASQWHPMSPSSSAGGTYYRYMSLPAYDSYQIYVLAIANYLDSTAHITVNYQYSNGGGGCPYLGVWNGTHYAIDNNLLRGGYSQTDVLDYYKLEKPLVPNGEGLYSVLLSEYETEHDFIDQVKLLAVDHSPGLSIAVSPQGEILTYRNPVSPITAVDDSGRNVRGLLKKIDDQYYEGANGSYVILNFGYLDTGGNAKLVLRADPPWAVKVSIHVQLQDQNNEWYDVDSFIPRAKWATEIIDLSDWLHEVEGELKVRLYFTANHKLDFAGLDITPEAAFTLQECELALAKYGAGFEIPETYERTDTTLENLLISDDIFAELTPGHKITMSFNRPTQKSTERDFIFIIEGHYGKAGSPYACRTAWREWYNLLEERTRKYGWIWANVAGYSCYYFGNTWYESKIPTQYREIPGESGLKEFLSEDVACYYYAGHLGRRGAAFTNRGGFDTQFYNDLPTGEFDAPRPLSKYASLPWNTVGCVDVSTDDCVTASITMSTDSLGTIMPGIFIHSGLGAGVSDWTKGYIATVLAIEEARAFIMTPKTLTQERGNTHAATFSITLLPGGWGEGDTPILFPDGQSATYRYVDLILSISTHYPKYHYYDSYADATYDYKLSEADFKFESTDTETWAEIWLQKSGWETGEQMTDLMNEIGWWQAGFAADTLGEFLGIPYLGSYFGLIPILIRGPNPPDQWVSLDRPVWANRTLIDPDGDDWGTISFYFRVVFRRDGLPRNYEFSLGMASWIDLNIQPYMYGNPWGSPIYYPRYQAISLKTKLRFVVSG